MFVCNTVVCNYLLFILELPLRKHVFCYLARGSKTYATNKYLSSNSKHLATSAKYNTFKKIIFTCASSHCLYFHSFCDIKMSLLLLIGY